MTSSRLKVTIWIGALGVFLSLLSGRAASVAALPRAPLSVAHWDSDHGLPPGPVGAICQTRDGYMWFGMEEGLGRFDGVRCTVFDARNTPELRSSHISALHEDRAGGLWIGMEGGGLCRLEKGRFTAFGRDEGLKNSQINVIAEDLDGTLWVGTDGGGLYQFTSNRFEHLPGRDGSSELFVVSINPDQSGSLWVGYRAGIRELRSGRIVGAWRKEALRLPDVTALHVDARGSVWIGSQAGLFSFANGSVSKQQFDPPLRNVQTICGAPDGGLWVGTVAGLYRVRDGHASRWTIAEGLAGNMIGSLCVDHEGSLWIGNNGSGVDQLKRSRFAVYGTRQGLAYDVATCLYEDGRSNIWIGTERGLNRLTTGGITRYTTNEGLSWNIVMTVCEDPRGGLWVGTLRGLNYFSNDRFTVFRAGDGLPSDIIWCSYRDRSGNVWIGTHDGLVRVQSGKFRAFTYDGAGLSHDDVRAICEDRAGRLWVGTSYGLNLLEGERFRVFKDAAPGHQFKVVLALHADADGSLWIGTMDKGLFRHRDGRFDHFSTRQGLFDDRIHQILEDEQGQLWMSSNRGIFSVHKSDLEGVAQGRYSNVTCTVFGKADGLLSVECNGTFQPAGSRSRDGRLWFPTTKGVAVIDPQDVLHSKVPPPVVIENVLLDGQPTPRGPKIEVTPGTERLDIHYTGLSFTAPKQVSFRYRLEGFDGAWITNLEERVAHYTHVPPGEYQFRVFGCNPDGVWNEQDASIGIVVRPFFWQTEWFRFLALLSALGATGLLVRVWVARKHRREVQALERQHALERERTRIAQDMHDGLGSNLVKISLLGEIAEADLSQPEAARAHIQKMARTARETVRDMDEIVWAVNPRNDTVENLANYLCAFAREHFELAPTRLNLEVPTKLPDRVLSADVRHNLFLAAKEALNNVVKHAGAADAWLTIELTDSVLVITVRDNGRGLSVPSGGWHGHGQENIRERLVQIGGTLECASDPGRGTMMVMKFPLDSPS